MRGWRTNPSLQQLADEIDHFFDVPFFDLVLRRVLYDKFGRKCSAFDFFARGAQGANRQQLDAGWDHLALPQVAVDRVRGHMYRRTLDLENGLELEKPVDDVRARFLRDACLLLHVVTVRVVLDLVVTDEVVVSLDVLLGFECVRL